MQKKDNAWEYIHQQGILIYSLERGLEQLDDDHEEYILFAFMSPTCYI